jgi:hypothetical protein
LRSRSKVVRTLSSPNSEKLSAQSPPCRRKARAFATSASFSRSRWISETAARVGAPASFPLDPIERGRIGINRQLRGRASAPALGDQFTGRPWHVPYRLRKRASAKGRRYQALGEQALAPAAPG